MWTQCNAGNRDNQSEARTNNFVNDSRGESIILNPNTWE